MNLVVFDDFLPQWNYAHHPQYPTPQRNRILLVVIPNELVFHHWFRVKPVLSEVEGMEAAFFRISFSIQDCLSSFFKRATSASRSFCCPDLGKA